MSPFKTPTPPYEGHNGRPGIRQPDWLDWITRLLRTPTPTYLTANNKRGPEHEGSAK